MLALPLYDDWPKSGVPLATIGLVTACVLIFLWQVGLSPRAAEAAIYSYGMIPAVVFGHAELPLDLRAVPAWSTLITSQFLHANLVHLLGNMLYLWIFGRGVESVVGFVRYLLLFLACGAVAGLVQGLTDPTGQVPMIGASGAIAGVLGAYLLLNPRSNVVVLVWIFLFVRLVSVPAVLVLGLWFLLQLGGALSVSPSEPGVAFWAHVGGFAAGVFLVLLLRPRGTRLLQPRRSRSYYVARPRDARARFGRHGDWGGPWG